METRSPDVAGIARLEDSFNSIEEKMGIELIVNQYGIGVDCHSQVLRSVRSGS